MKKDKYAILKENREICRRQEIRAKERREQRRKVWKVLKWHPLPWLIVSILAVYLHAWWVGQMKIILDKTLSALYNIKYKLNIKTGVEMASAKNYTDEMVATMTEQYTANPTRDTVDALAREFGKTTRSIIAKLSREGVYVAQPRTTKTGEPIVSKNEIVSDIASLLQVEVDDIASLEKATKIDLKNLVTRLQSVVQ